MNVSSFRNACTPDRRRTSGEPIQRSSVRSRTAWSMSRNAANPAPVARFASGLSSSRSTSRSCVSCAGSTARTRASAAMAPTRSASPQGTKVAARARMVASSAAEKVAIGRRPWGAEARLELGAPGGRRGGRRQSIEALGRQGLAAQWPVLAVAEGVVGLDERVQLGGALVDHGGLRVPEVALDGELIGIAVRAVDLDRVEGALHGVVGGVPLGEGGLAGVADAVVLEKARAPDEEPSGLDPGQHLRQHLLDQLMLPDLLAERLPLV